MQACIKLIIKICTFLTEIQLRILPGTYRGVRSTITTLHTWRSTGTATFGFAIDSHTTASGTNTFHEWHHRTIVRICYSSVLCWYKT